MAGNSNEEDCKYNRAIKAYKTIEKLDVNGNSLTPRATWPSIRLAAEEWSKEIEVLTRTARSYISHFIAGDPIYEELVKNKGCQWRLVDDDEEI